MSTAGTGLFEIRGIVVFDCDFTEHNLLFVSFAILSLLGFIAPLIYLYFATSTAENVSVVMLV